MTVPDDHTADDGPTTRAAFEAIVVTESHCTPARGSAGGTGGCRPVPPARYEQCVNRFSDYYSIRALVLSAHRNDVEVENGIDVWNDDPELPSWTVETTGVRDRRG